MDTKSKSTAGKQVIGFLCFVMSFSIFFSVGLLLLEQPVYGDGRFVLSEAFDGDVQSTQRYQSAVASRFQTLMVDAGADGSFENLSFSSINEDQANVIYRISNSESGKTFSNTNVNLFQESVPEGYNYIVDYRNGNVKVTGTAGILPVNLSFGPFMTFTLRDTGWTAMIPMNILTATNPLWKAMAGRTWSCGWLFLKRSFQPKAPGPCIP